MNKSRGIYGAGSTAKRGFSSQMLDAVLTDASQLSSKRVRRNGSDETDLESPVETPTLTNSQASITIGDARPIHRVQQSSRWGVIPGHSSQANIQRHNSQTSSVSPISNPRRLESHVNPQRGHSRALANADSNRYNSIRTSSPYVRVSQSHSSQDVEHQRGPKVVLGDNEDDESNSTDGNGGRSGQCKGKNFGYLWTGAHRRQKTYSSVGHENMMKGFKPYLLAVLFSDSAGGEATMWPDQKKRFLNNVMIREWVVFASKIGARKGVSDDDVKAQPTPAESRKLYDSISDWRSRAIETIRTMVGSEYGWVNCKSPEEKKRVCESLLRDDSFTCQKPEECPLRRFCAPIISRALTATFWNRKNVGIATYVHTKEFFDSMPELAVVFVCTCIEHAIREYQTGVQRTEKFESVKVKASVQRHRLTYRRQCATRRAKLKELLLVRVRAEMDDDHIAHTAYVEPATNPYNETWDDLPRVVVKDGVFVEAPDLPRVAIKDGKVVEADDLRKKGSVGSSSQLSSMTSNAGYNAEDEGGAASNPIQPHVRCLDWLEHLRG